ncbi:hypothetical protein DFH07DRAFT_964359 [Mycena maculata]|uniref:Uncharacterized protein n=1 Tax=Mycena maculata TaxID=230809 RepID=A0AAD7IJ17_9AGAR|nr:hypothetical protein DFH07DRAFT_964359 [Mycena maculata]
MANHDYNMPGGGVWEDDRNQSFQSFSPHHQSPATPYQTNSQGTGYHASQAQQPAGYGWQKGAGYYAPQAQHGAEQGWVSAGHNPAQAGYEWQQGIGHNPWQGQQPAGYDWQQDTGYDAPQAQQGMGQEWIWRSTTQGNNTPQAQRSAPPVQVSSYNVGAEYNSGVGNHTPQVQHPAPQAQQGMGQEWMSAGYNPAQTQQPAEYDAGNNTPQAQRSAPPVQASGYNAGAEYNSAVGNHTPQVQHPAPQAQQGMGQEWMSAGYNPAQTQQPAEYDAGNNTPQAQRSAPPVQASGYKAGAEYNSTVGNHTPQVQHPEALQFQLEPPPRIDLRNPPNKAQKRRIEIEDNGKRRQVDTEPKEVEELRSDLEYEKAKMAHTRGKMREVQKQTVTLREELDVHRHALRDMGDTAKGQTGMYDALQASHQRAIDDLKRESQVALKAQEEQFKRYMDDEVAKLRRKHEAELGKEQAQAEGRFAAMAARQVRPGSRSAPYTISEAESARQDRRLKEARGELEKHPGVFLVPHPAPDDEDESGDESLDEAEKQQAALMWAWKQLEREKRRKEQKEQWDSEEEEDRKGDDLERARKSQQEELGKRKDNAYKSTVRDVFGKATKLWTAKDYVNYQPASEEEMKRCKRGEVVPPEGVWRFFFGKSFAKCLHNRILINRLVEETVTVVAREGKLPKVTKDYLRALHLNVLRGARFQWKLHQQRDDETKEEANKRAEKYEEERRLQTNNTSRKTRKRMVRLATAKKMKQIKLQEGKPGAAEVFKNAGDVVKALGNDGMSSEEERVDIVTTRSGQQKKTTVFAVKVLDWREVIIDKQVKMLDWYRRHQKKRGYKGYDRVRVEESSASPPPLKLPRNFFDPRWLKKQKKFDPEIEGTLKIRKPNFQLLDFDFNGVNSDKDKEDGGGGEDADGEDDNDEMRVD